MRRKVCSSAECAIECSVPRSVASHWAKSGETASSAWLAAWMLEMGHRRSASRLRFTCTGRSTQKAQVSYSSGGKLHSP